MLATLPGQAQWIKTSGPKPGKTAGIAGGQILSLVMSGNHLFTGTAYGVYRTSDDGDSRQQVDSWFSYTYTWPCA